MTSPDPSLHPLCLRPGPVPLDVGYGNWVLAERIVAVLSPASAPARRLREEAQQACLLLDATQGRRTRALIMLDSRHLVLSAVQPRTLRERLAGMEDSVESTASGSEEE